MAHIWVGHGPNLNLLGSREPQTYGSQNLEEINARLVDLGQLANIKVDCFQTNHEGMMIDELQRLGQGGAEFILFNPGAWTHTSIALRDTLLAIKLPFIEVHMSNIFSREAFRHHSYFSDIAQGVIVGFGVDAYECAMNLAIKSIKRTLWISEKSEN